jgi:DNA anti-recombination protein RmuC
VPQPAAIHHLSEKIAEQAAQLTEQPARLVGEFENIANRILKANATDLSATSQKELAAVLDPLRQRYCRFPTEGRDHL